MNAPTDEASANEAEVPPHVRFEGRPMYLRGAHWFARTGYGSILLLYVVGIVAAVSTSTMQPLGARDAVGALMMIVVPLILVTALRTSALYGSAEGLEIVRWGKRSVVPWAKIGTAEYAWWSLNYAARVARLPIHEDKERTILFFANDRILADLEAMRAGHAPTP